MFISHIHVPFFSWIKDCDKNSVADDVLAAVVVTALLIPQSLAYAMLAGLPVEAGLYASIAPLVVYAFLGSSRTLSIGPVALISLLTASTIASTASQFTVSAAYIAACLALVSGCFLLLMGVFRLGFLTNFLSHSVISGFISASGILISLSQLKHILGINAHGENGFDILISLLSNLSSTHLTTTAIGITSLIFLFFCRYYLKPILVFFKLDLTPINSVINTFIKVSPIIAVVGSVFITQIFTLQNTGVSIVADLPKGLPKFTLALPTLDLLEALLIPAALISIIGYIESISIGKTLAAKRRQKIDANQEFIALGGANIAVSAFGGFPVTAGFSRSIVNFETGAKTQLASIFAALGIILVCLFLTRWLYYLPKATLAATIIVAVVALVDFSIFKKSWRFSKSDFWALTITATVTLFFGVEYGLALGVGTSLALFMYRSSTPNIPEVGLLDGTQHFRNKERFSVKTKDHVLMLRPDESLYFANIEFLEEKIARIIYTRDKVAHVVLMCSAVNDIDYSAVMGLEHINTRLADQGILLHLSEVKGPVMNALEKSQFLSSLSGQVFVSQYDAYQFL